MKIKSDKYQIKNRSFTKQSDRYNQISHERDKPKRFTSKPDY